VCGLSSSADFAVDHVQVVEAHLAWAAWAVELDIVSADRLRPPAAQDPAAGPHAVTALVTLLHALKRAADPAALADGCLVPGAERTLRHVTLTVLSFQKQVHGLECGLVTCL
jgi:hypothetical protein